MRVTRAPAAAAAAAATIFCPGHERPFHPAARRPPASFTTASNGHGGFLACRLRAGREALGTLAASHTATAVSHLRRYLQSSVRFARACGVMEIFMCVLAECRMRSVAFGADTADKQDHRMLRNVRIYRLLGPK